MRQNFYKKDAILKSKELYFCKGERKMEDILKLTHQEDILTAALGGEIDHHSAVSVRGRIDEALFMHRPKTLVIDIARVDFMDSSGLGLIMGRLAKTKEIGTTLVIKNPSKRVLRMLKMAGLDRMIPIQKD